MPNFAYVKIDFEKCLKDLSALEREQFPYVLAQTVTQCATGSQAAIRKEMPSRFHIRSRWELLGVRIEMAKKSDVKTTGSCEAIVKDIDPYMSRQETGGEKKVSGKSLAIPSRFLIEQLGARTGSGAIKKKFLPKSLLAEKRSGSAAHRKGRRQKPKPFFLARGGKVSIVVRAGSERYPIKTLYTLRPSSHIKPRFEFEKTVQAFTDANFEKLFAKNMAAAVADRKEK